MIFGFGETSTSKERQIIKSSNNIKNYDFLLFFDSRAMSIDKRNYNNTIFYRLIDTLKQKNLSFLAISRPKNLTIFATLLNFLKLNKYYKFKILINNLGFVDCTPKKQLNIDDMLVQINQFYNFDGKIIKKEDYKLIGGGIESIKIIDYSQKYILYLSEIITKEFENIFFINTPLVSRDIEIQRERPQSFFSQLEITNGLIKHLVEFDINKNKLIDISNISYTYDGVHYTRRGHSEIYKEIIKEINL